MKKLIASELYHIGVCDRRIELFENVYPVPDGVTYNSYLLADDCPVVFDTADAAFTEEFLLNLEDALSGRGPEYLVISHMEPDHSASVKALADKYPAMKIVVNARSKAFLEGFFPDLKNETVVVKDGDELDTGSRILKFIFAPMVHWPEVMFTYDAAGKTLFTADAFGSFGSSNGIVCDADGFSALIPEYRRYYTNIVGKYGVQVSAVLKKVSPLAIERICPLHGAVLNEAEIKVMAALYADWAGYVPEQRSAVIAYASVYGNTKRAAEYLAGRLSEKGVPDVKVFDVSKTHFSYIVAECFRKSHIVLASVTYNGGIFTNMETLVREIAHHGITGRKFALIENGSWAAQSARLIRGILEETKGAEFIGEPVSFRSSPKPETFASLDALADELAADIINGN